MKPLPPMPAVVRDRVRMVVRQHPSFPAFLAATGGSSRSLTRPMIADFQAWLDSCPLCWGSGGQLNAALHTAIRQERRRQAARRALQS